MYAVFVWSAGINRDSSRSYIRVNSVDEFGPRGRKTLIKSAANAFESRLLGQWETRFPAQNSLRQSVMSVRQQANQQPVAQSALSVCLQGFDII